MTDRITVTCPTPGCGKQRSILIVGFHGDLSKPPYVKVCRSCSQLDKIISDEQRYKTSLTLKKKIGNPSEGYLAFQKKYPVSQKTRIEIKCDSCRRVQHPIREVAERAIIANDTYLCRSCGLEKYHAANPASQDTREKLRNGRLGKKQSTQAKDKMSKSKKDLYNSEKGKALKSALSKATARAHQDHRFDRSKRKGLYPSSKTMRPVAYNSSYELRQCWLLDQDRKVVTYETQVYFEIADRGRALDFLITFRGGKKKAIEVKPEKRLKEPRHIGQIEDSRRYAELEGWDFAVVTEEDFGMSAKEITAWADELRMGLEGVDYPGLRREAGRAKARRHYRNKIRDDTIEVSCVFCNDTHVVLRKTYTKNVERNTRYICEREGGSISGKKPKPKKDNPYVKLGMKECTSCDRILPTDLFHKDKSRSDGIANRCKECRAGLTDEANDESQRKA